MTPKPTEKIPNDPLGYGNIETVHRHNALSSFSSKLYKEY